MSYVKSAVVLDGIARIVEVHGLTWCCLDVRAYGLGQAKHYRELADRDRKKGSDPAHYEEIAADFEKIAGNPRSLKSGLAQEILDRHLSPVTPENRGDWMRFAVEEDMPEYAGKANRPPAVMVNFDVFNLADTEDSSYAGYRLFLPEGWSYERWKPERMIEFLNPRLPESDKPRLGQIKNNRGE